MSLFGPPNIEKLKAKRDVNGLIKALSYGTPQVRGSAASALGELGDPKAVEPLVAMLKDQNKDKRFVSYERERAAKALGNIGDPRAVEPLAAVLKDNWDLRKSAAVALGEIGDKKGIDFLVDFLQDKDLPCTENSHYGFEPAVESLEKLGWKPDKSHAAVSYWLLKNEWKPCVEMGEIAVDGITSALEQFKSQKYPLEDSSDEDFQKYTKVRQTAYNALRHIGGDRVIEFLLSIALQANVSESDAYFAANALGEIGDQQAIEPLQSWLEQFYSLLEPAFYSTLMTNKQVRMPRRVGGFARTLGKLQAKQSSELLLKYWDLVEKSKNLGVVKIILEGNFREDLIFAFGELGEIRAVKLINAYTFEDNKIATTAVEALGKIANPPAIEYLLALLTRRTNINNSDIARAIKVATLKSGTSAVDQISAIGDQKRLNASDQYFVKNKVKDVLKELIRMTGENLKG